MSEKQDPKESPRDVIADSHYLFLGSRLKRLAEQMQADATRVSQRAGIAILPGQFPLLTLLSEQGPQTVGTLSKALGLSQPVTSRNINKLIEADLVKGDRSDADGRSKIVSLSRFGEQVIGDSKKTVLPYVEAAVKEVVEGRSGAFLEQIAQIERALSDSTLTERATRIAARELIPAAEADLPGIVAMMNLAYRGDGTQSAWTTEAGYISGDRTNEALLRAEVNAKPDASLLTWRDTTDGALKGSVWLEPLGGDKWYLGSLTVDPLRQNGGLGRTLLYCAEQWIRERGGQCVQLTVINVREPLIAWYLRRGYQNTGETEAFPYGDNRFGTPLRDDLCFVVLEKALTQ